MNINDLFKSRTKEYFGQDSDIYLELLNEKPTHGFFLNTLKATKEDILSVIDFDYSESTLNPNAFYTNEEAIGKTKAYELGLIYPQDVESSYSASLFNENNINLIVDLCAAPGGKSINIINKYPDAICVSNDINHSRAGELAKNLERLGLTNSIITNKEPDDLITYLKGKADLVILDAPCSGEGMIRKYPEILDTYSLDYINQLANIQSELLEVAYKLIKKDGYILYSTCTYAFEEDEDQIKKFLSLHKDIELIKLKSNYNYSKFDGTIKLCPLNSTEGQFISLLKKNSETECIKPKLLNTVKNTIVENFIKENISINDYYLYRIKDNFYLSFTPLYDLGCSVIRYGIYLGELKKDRFEPSHNLYRSIYLITKFKNVIDLNDDEYIDYVKGLEIKKNIKAGYYLLTHKGHSIGFGKCSNNIIKNKYPKGLRRV